MATTRELGLMRNIILTEESCTKAHERTGIARDKMCEIRMRLHEAIEAVERAQESEAILWNEVRELQKELGI